MVIVDQDSHIVLVNTETEKLFGHSRSELLGKPVDVLVPERFRAAPTDPRAACVDHPTDRRAMAAGQQLVGLRSDGSEFPAEIRTSPAQTNDGLLISSVIRDVTERIRADHALRRAKDAAEAANAELEAFSYSVAHDLRTPLRAMSGYSTTLLEDYGDKLDPSARQQLTRIVSGAQRMSDLIDALLSLARLARTEPQRERVDLDELAHSVIGQLRAGEPDRTVDFVAADDLVVQGDPRLLRLLLDNLLGNAWKFTGKQPAARVELGTEQRRRRHRLLRPRQRRGLRHEPRSTSCSSRSGACTSRRTSRAPASASPPSSASFAATAAGSGPKAPRRMARPSASPCRATHRRPPQQGLPRHDPARRR